MCECVFVYDLFKLEMQQNKKGSGSEGEGLVDRGGVERQFMAITLVLATTHS